jgi:hypothetical protein
MGQAVQEHIEAYGLGPDDLLFPQWMFAYVRSGPVAAPDDGAFLRWYPRQASSMSTARRVLGTR